ncbi:MAG: YARHG domain-containing protein [Clostridiales bacterium]|nr:YARHG domain-containing protein [Clostridiales bacterium]
MFCEKCGNKVQEGERFCSYCGNRIEEPGTQEKHTDIPDGMGYGYKPPVKTPKRIQEDDDFDEEWREEEKKEKITFIILGIIIVALVVSIVIGVIFLLRSSGMKEEKRVPQLTEEQKEELNHGRTEGEGNEASADEAEVTPEPTVMPESDPLTEGEAGAVEAESDGRIAAENTPESVQETAPVPTQEVTPVPTQEPPVVVHEEADFIIPDSSTRYLTNADLSLLSEWEVRVARNEIYARHGRIFKTDDLAEYFEEKDWYVGSIPPELFDDSYLNEIEIENIKFITNFEKAHNLNQ